MKPSVNRCPRGGLHRWGPRRNETRASVELTCVRCGQGFTVDKNPTPFADMMENSQ